MAGNLGCGAGWGNPDAEFVMAGLVPALTIELAMHHRELMLSNRRSLSPGGRGSGWQVNLDRQYPLTGSLRFFPRSHAPLEPNDDILVQRT